MQITKNVPAHWFDRSQPILATFIVLGPGHADSTAGYQAGRIKTVRFGPHSTSPLVVVEPIKRDARMVGVKGLHLTAAETEKGSRFLRDMYAEEGRLDDYEKYVAREQAIVNGMIADPLEEFDPRLPAKLLQWRQGRGVRDKFVWDVEPPTTPAALPADEKPAVRRRQAVEPPAGGTF